MFHMKKTVRLYFFRPPTTPLRRRYGESQAITLILHTLQSSTKVGICGNKQKNIPLHGEALTIIIRFVIKFLMVAS